MAIVGGPFVSSVAFSVTPVSGTPVDLTSTTGNGISFPTAPNSAPTTPLFDTKNSPVYNITITFNPAGADSLGSIIIINPGTNVKKFSVRFFVPSYPNQPFTFSPSFSNNPLYYNSTIINSQPSIVTFPPQVPSPLSGILISVLSTTDNT